MAKRVTKGIDLYRETMSLLDKTSGNAFRGHKILAEAGKKDLTDLLSGAYTPSQTRGAFARNAVPPNAAPGRRRSLTVRQMRNRGLKGAIPVNPVNVQSGRLLEGVALRKKSGGGALQEFDLVIDGVDYARYVLATGGTRVMVSRGVQRELKKRFGPRNKAFVDTFVRTSRTP